MPGPRPGRRSRRPDRRRRRARQRRDRDRCVPNDDGPTEGSVP